VAQVQLTATASPVDTNARSVTYRRTIQLDLLGGFELSLNGRHDSLPLSSRRVVAFLAVAGRPLLRVYVAGMLWPDVSEERAGASLRSALWRLRRLKYGLLDVSSTYLCVKPCIAIDFVDAGARAHRLLTRDGAFEDDDYDAMAPERELLPDVYEEWVVIERERFRQLRLHALEALCDRLVAAGRFAEAVQAGLAAVRGEPLRESAQRALIRAHLAEGNPSEALKQFRSFKHILENELGLEPTEALRSLLPMTRL